MSNAINKLIPPKLEPCPHCGSEPIMKPREHNVSYIVICWRCGLNGPTDELGVQPCADAWNRLSRAARLLAAVETIPAEPIAATVCETWATREFEGWRLAQAGREARGATLEAALLALAEQVKQ